MTDEAGQNPIDIIAKENEELRLRVAQLEEQVSMLVSQHKATVRDISQLSQFRKLLELRDNQVKKYTDELERKNQQLQTWLNALRMYQEVFEVDPAVMFAVNKAGKVLLFNRAAIEYFGDPAALVNKSVADLPGLGSLVQQLISGLKNDSVRKGEIEISGRKISVQVFRIGNEQDLRGYLCRCTFI